MKLYFFKRVLLIFPTIFGIMVINFAIVQLAPGGPVDQMVARIKGNEISALSKVNSSGSDFAKNTSGSTNENYASNKGIEPKLIQELEKQYGFDKPFWQRFWIMIKSYAVFDFGKSFYQNETVINLILEKLPVSITLGIFSTFIMYIIAVPLGIRKAIKDGSKFDISTTTILTVLYAIPSFLFAVILIVLFAGGSFFNIFPLRGLYSDNFASLSIIGKILDYLWHIFLPVLCLVLGSFTTLCMLTKNSFLEEIQKQYVLAAYAYGIPQKRILYNHIFRNAMLIVIAGFPAAFIGAFFSGSLLIETIFSLDGLGLLGFEAIMTRDYPIIFGTLYIFTLLGLMLGIISDIVYVLIDPRIDFNKINKS
jgi:microcin C transport system permease protein